QIESSLSNALGRKVEFGDLSLSILGGSVAAKNIKIADDPAFSSSPFLTAGKLEIGVELIPLIFSKKLNVTGIVLDKPSIVLLSGPNGTWNFSSLGGGPTSPSEPAAYSKDSKDAGNIAVAALEVNEGTVQIGKAQSQTKPLTIEKVNIEVKDFSSDKQ